MESWICARYCCMLLMMSLSACDTYYFVNPLPLSEKDVNKFPKEFRGSWMLDDDTLTIGKDYFIMSNNRRHEIINGIYVNPGDTIGFQRNDTTRGWSKHMEADRPFESLQSIRFDSSRNPIDTVLHYIIKDDKIYKKEGDDLTMGSHFLIKNDTILCITVSPRRFELGINARLRQISGNLFIINVSIDRRYDMQERWWQIYLLEKTPDKMIHIRGLSPKKIDRTDVIYEHQQNHFIDSQWNKEDLIRLIDDGFFADTVLSLDRRKAIKIK